MKAGMAQWLLDVWDHYDEKWAKHASERTRVNATYFPGWAYARALALRNVYPHVTTFSISILPSLFTDVLTPPSGPREKSKGFRGCYPCFPIRCAPPG
jgi:hypothetical protein